MDEDSLNSLLDGNGTGDYFDPVWVNLIRCDDDHDVGVQPPFEHSNGRWVVDEGWMMIAACSINSSWYSNARSLDDFWRVEYMVPPEGVRN